MSNIPLKKNKYQEYLDTLISENTYSVAEQINTSIEIAGKVLKVIAADLGFTEVNVNSIVRTADLYGDDNKAILDYLVCVAFPRVIVFGTDTAIIGVISKDNVIMR